MRSALAIYSKFPLLPFTVACVLLAIFSLTRIALTLYAGADLAPYSLWPSIFFKGFWFDFAVTIALIAPLCLYEALLPSRWRASRWHSILRLTWLWFTIALLLFSAASEITFWLEFSTRLNFIALDYLIYTHEVIGNIRQSYPVAVILSAIGLTSAITVVLLATRISLADNETLSRGQRTALVIFAVLGPTFVLSLANIDQMEGTGNNYVTELSGNGLFTIAAAMRRNELDYDRFYKTNSQEAANAELMRLGSRVLPMSPTKVNFGQNPARDIIPFVKRPRNVVLITVESLSASFLGVYGSDKGLTPNMDRLAQSGMKFERLFATGTRTVRGLEALSLGTPPVPGQAIVRRPNNDHLATIGEVLLKQGFSTSFFYGGYGYFDNMNAYFGANNYKVVDRTDIPKKSIVFENVWGVADEVLFENVLRTFDAKGAIDKPFFAHVMTTSNHRPYTYPDGRIDIKSPGGRDGGVKYTDYAIGKFIEEARAKPWFKDTLFVIVADHCAAVAGKSKLPVGSYHIPMIFYAPDMVNPSTYTPIMSQIDIAPTLVEVLGMEGGDRFFGRSIFREGEALQRAFISNYQELGYLRNGILTVLLPKQKVQAFHIDPKTYAATPAEVDPQLETEAIAYYQTASRAFKSGALKMDF
jgi:phosphoglycerol transferase MdoB-like AlkP superfamily enzyme